MEKISPPMLDLCQEHNITRALCKAPPPALIFTAPDKLWTVKCLPSHFVFFSWMFWKWRIWVLLHFWVFCSKCMILVLAAPIGNAVVEFKELKGQAAKHGSTKQQYIDRKKKKKRICAFKFSIKPYAFVLNFSAFVIYCKAEIFHQFFSLGFSVAE